MKQQSRNIFRKNLLLGTLSVMTLILAGNIPLADDVNAESLPPVTGQCGSSNGGTFPSQPTTNLCSAGIQNWIDNNASDGTYNWECLGSGGGSTTTCSATKATLPPPPPPKTCSSGNRDIKTIDFVGGGTNTWKHEISYCDCDLSSVQVSTSRVAGVNGLLPPEATAVKTFNFTSLTEGQCLREAFVSGTMSNGTPYTSYISYCKVGGSLQIKHDVPQASSPDPSVHGTVALNCSSLSVSPTPQNIAVGASVAPITVSGSTSGHTFTLNAGTTGITKSSTCSTGATSCALTAPTATGTATLTVAKTGQTSAVATINVTPETNATLTVSPEFQTVQVGCTPKTIRASGGSDYTFSLIPRTTGISKASCSDGSAGSCSFTKATSANDIAILTVTSDGESKQSLIATYQNYNTDDFFQCFLECLFGEGGSADQCALQCLDELIDEPDCSDNDGDDNDGDDDDQFPPPPGETPDPPSDTISSDFPEPPTNPTPNPPSGIGSSGLSCQEFSNIPTENAFYVRGLQDTAWQRAILSDPGGEITLSEQKLVKITGTAEPHTEVFVFLSSSDEEGFSQGTCFSAGESDKFGYFSLELNPRLLWGNIGDTINVSSFFRLEETWDQIPQDVQGNTSSVAPLTLGIKGETSLTLDNSCTEICSTGIREAQRLKPENLEERLRGTNFKNEEGKEILIGRMPGPHTFSGGIVGEKVEDIREMSRIIRKTILMEALKRALLGNVNTNGTQPGLSTLNVEQFEEANRGDGNGSKRTNSLVSSLHTLLTGGGSERDYALVQIDTLLGETNGLQTAGGYLSLKHINAPVPELFSEIFPEQASTEDSWAEDALKIIYFWTGTLVQNDCLLENDHFFAENFEGFPQEIRQCDMVFLLSSSSF